MGTQIVQARDYLETPSLFAWTLVILLLSLNPGKTALCSAEPDKQEVVAMICLEKVTVTFWREAGAGPLLPHPA